MNEETTTISKKQKSREPYKFHACTIKIILHAPIETTVKKCESYWCSLWNQTKKITYNISKFYLKRSEQHQYNNESDESSIQSNDIIIGDE